MIYEQPRKNSLRILISETEILDLPKFVSLTEDMENRFDGLMPYNQLEFTVPHDTTGYNSVSSVYANKEGDETTEQRTKHMLVVFQKCVCM